MYTTVNNFFARAVYNPLAAFFGTTAPQIVYVPVAPKTLTTLTPTPAQQNIIQAATKTPAVNQVVTRIIERVAEPQSLSGYVSKADLETRLNELSNSIATKFYAQTSGSGGNITNIYQEIANSQRIDQLSGTHITNPVITGGSLSGTSISVSSLAVTDNATSTFGGGVLVNGILDASALYVNGAPFVAGVSSQWTTSGSDIYYTTGNVGIGSTTPGTKLAVSGSGYFSGGVTVGSIFGAGLSTSCNSVTGKLVWDAVTGQFACATDAGSSGSGIGALGAQYSATQTGATQTLATSSDTNLGLTITSAGNTHIFTPTFTGFLSVARGGTGTSTAPSYGKLLVGNSLGGYDLLATSSLGIQSTLDFSYPLVNTANTISLAFGTTTANTYSALQVFNANASTTQLTVSGNSYLTNTTLANATSTNFAITALASTILKTDASGNVIPAIAGTDYAAAGNYISTLGSGYASTTGTSITFATSTLTANGQTFGVKIVPSASTLTLIPTLSGTLDNTGLTNSTISGVSLGGTLASLTATNGTLTFSGSYTGTTAQTVGLNLTNANTWTGLQTFNYSSSTIYSSFATASTTNLVINSQSFNNLLGAGLSNVGGALTVTGVPASSISLTKGNFLVGDDSGIAQATSTVFISSTGKLGVGTTNPSVNLHVVGNTAPDIRVDTISSGDPTVSFANAGVRKWSLYQQASTNNFGFYDWTNSTFRLLAMANGNVGIGTTTPGSLLSVGGDAVGINFGLGTTTFSTTGGINLAKGGCFAVGGTCLVNTPAFSNTLANGGTATTTFYNGGVVFSDGSKLTQSASASNFFWDETNAKLGLGTSTPFAQLSLNTIAGSPAFAIGSSTGTQFIVDASGRVGIGTTTPSLPLYVTQSTSALNAASFDTVCSGCTTGINIFNRANANNSGSAINFQTFSNGGVQGLYAQIIGRRGASSLGGEFLLSTMNSVGSLVERLRVDANGSLGLGTTTPPSLLTVGPTSAQLTSATPIFLLGTSTLASPSAAGTYIAVNAPTGFTGNFLDLQNAGVSQFKVTGTGNVGIGTTTPWGLLSVNPDAIPAGAPQFVIGSSTQTSFVVDRSGKVGIGTTSPKSYLSVTALSPANADVFTVGAGISTTPGYILNIVSPGNGTAATSLLTAIEHSPSNTGASLNVFHGGSDTSAAYVAAISNAGTSIRVDHRKYWKQCMGSNS